MRRALTTLLILLIATASYAQTVKLSECFEEGGAEMNFIYFGLNTIILY